MTAFGYRPSGTIIPAKAGIYFCRHGRIGMTQDDSRFRGNDGGGFRGNDGTGGRLP